MKKAILVILGILLVAGLAGGGVWYWQKSKKSTIKETSEAPTTKDISSDFLQYTDNDLGFSIKYPKEWQEAPYLCKDHPEQERCSDWIYPFKGIENIFKLPAQNGLKKL